MDVIGNTEILAPPDVGHAITTNQVNTEKNNQKNMEELNKRRRETYALRDLWRTLQERRSRRQYELRPSPYSENEKFLETRPSADTIRLPLNEERQRPMTSRDVGSFQLQCSSVSRQSQSASTSPRTKAAPIPYHTAITMPRDKHKDSRDFNALNRKMVCRLPNIYDRSHHMPSYTTRDVREWKHEIRKIVPTRPKLFIPASATPRDMSIIMPPDTERSVDSACHFRRTTYEKTKKGTEYMINPEWPSEKYTPDSARARAHCVYTWNV